MTASSTMKMTKNCSKEIMKLFEGFVAPKNSDIDRVDGAFQTTTPVHKLKKVQQQTK
jgi:hypothetical protein